MKSISVVVLAVFVFVFVALAGVQARPPEPGKEFQGEGGRGRGGPVIRLLNRLDLTDAQKVDAALILKKHREEVGKVADGMAQAKKDLMNTLAADSYSEAAVDQAARKLAEQVAQATVLGGKIVNELKSVLTPEQLEVLREFGQRRAERIDDHAASRLSRLDEWIASHLK
jgi:Spy/CpxP family protein refolding chaperone